MSFTTLKFILFFFIVAAAYYLLPKKCQKYLLILASYAFYVMACKWTLALLLLADTAFSYVCALGSQREWLGKKKFWTGLGVVGVLCVLFLFKYFDVFCSSFLPVIGVAYDGIHLLMPLGISFFSFAICAYLFDVQNGKIEAERSFIDYANFVSFFPVLQSGPIGKPRDFLPQLKAPVSYNSENVRRGVLRFVWGAFKKMVVADTLLQIVNSAYADPTAVSGGAMLVAVLVYSLQLYFDFASYSDMAIGVAGILGLRVQENFSAPYFSRNTRTFWKKWHMSLIGWFREYLYFPLGGSRKGSTRTKINVLIVFIVSGLWHGAAFTYIFWGLINGMYQVVGMLTEPARKRLRAKLHIREESPVLAVCQAIVLFLLLSAARIFFRSADMKQAIYVIKHILLILRYGFGMDSVKTLIPLRRLILIIIAMIPCVIEDARIALKGERIPAGLLENPWRYWGAILVLALMIAVFGVYGEGIDMRQFVYFQF